MDRRNFLKLAGIGAVVAIAAPIVLAKPKAVKGLRSSVAPTNMYHGVERYAYPNSSDILCPRTAGGLDVYSCDGKTFKGIYRQ